MKRLVLLLLPACGFGFADDESGGGENLPTSGAGPYQRVPNDFTTPASEPFVIQDNFENYADPDCAPRDGGGYRCYFTYSTDDDPRNTIGVAELADVHSLPDVPPRRVFSGSADGVSAPAIASGPNDTLVMFHQVGADTDPSIAFATSFDGGETWTDGAAVGINGTSPAVALVDGVYHLFFADDGDVWHATSPDPTGFTVDPDPARVNAGDPFVYVSTSDAGRQHWGLFFTRGDAIHHAASFDGMTWQGFNDGEPILDAPAGGPCVVPEGAHTILLFHEEDNLHLGVAAALP